MMRDQILETPKTGEDVAHPTPPEFCFFRGRVALYASLLAMGIGPSDEVIVPGFTCVVVPNAVRFAGAIPVYVDVDEETYNCRPDLIEQKITSNTRAIVAQHTYGIPARMDVIGRIAREHGLFLIEDCAHTLASRYNGRLTGTFGDIAIFSSQWSKPVTTGLGGWANVNNPDLRQPMRDVHAAMRPCHWREELSLRLQYLAYRHLFTSKRFWFAQNTYRKLSGLGLGIASGMDDEIAGRMSRHYATTMSGWQSRMLTEQLRDLETNTEHRLQLTRQYTRLLSERGFVPVAEPPGCESVLLRYPVRVQNKFALLEKARDARIELGDWFLSPVHPVPDRWEVADYQRGLCPVAETLCREVINLPNHERITPEQAVRITDFVAHHAVR